MNVLQIQHDGDVIWLRETADRFAFVNHLKRRRWYDFPFGTLHVAYSHGTPERLVILKR